MNRVLPRYVMPLALFALAFGLRSYGLTAPLLDYHSWRQADTAAIARNFTLGGYRILYPQVDWGGLTPGYVESEFPLYSFTLALLFGSLGIHAWVGRLLTALCGAAAVAALFGLVAATGTRILARRAALYAGVTLALMPFALYFGRTVMPDTLMLLTAILALWSFLRWLEQPGRGRFALALLCGTLAPLAKTPNLIILSVPLAYLVLVYRPPRRTWPALALYAACVALPILLWSQHARTLPLDPRLSFGIGEKLFDLTLLRDPQFYLLLARWSIENLVLWLGLPLLLVGLVLPLWQSLRTPSDSHPVPRPDLLPHAWLLGVCVFLLAGAVGVVGQDYYILPLAGPFAWLIGTALAAFHRPQASTERSTSPAHADRSTKRPIAHIVVVAFFLVFAALSFQRVAPLYQTADFYRILGQRVDLALPEGERVGVIAPAVSEILFYGGRQGWRLDPGVIVPGGLASLGPDLGVRYVLIGDPWLSERRDVLTTALVEYRRVPAGPYALLLDLTQPGEQGPFEMDWETGHLIVEPFLSAWRESGGRAALGFALSDALETPEGRIQYFERGVLLESDAQVARIPVGQRLLEAQGESAQPTTLDPRLEAAWSQAGGAAWLGEALSPLRQVDDRQIQYFEYGTLELSPGGVAEIGASGRRLLDIHGLSTERQIELAAR